MKRWAVHTDIVVQRTSPGGCDRSVMLPPHATYWLADSTPGTDLSPIQPSWVPPNCKFEIDDFDSTWDYSQPFDFIHARNIEGSVKDHHRLFSQAMTYLRPGGWFELGESTVGVFSDDDTLSRATYLLEWRDRLIEASEKFGKRMGVAKNYKQWMIDAGFENVREEIYKV